MILEKTQFLWIKGDIFFLEDEILHSKSSQTLLFVTLFCFSWALFLTDSYSIADKKLPSADALNLLLFLYVELQVVS